MANLALQLRDYRLTTAEILYHMPDHPGLLQSYVWQDLDLAPRYPVLRRFLDFWHANLDGRLHSVRLGSRTIVSQAELRVAAEWRLH
ncbi:usg protein [Azospirillum sp. ST 5-10]|uniref:usg protein n=1 Tax=unclassified Azospirillum TaxID=2630922 RepID=UPI003F4A7A27